MKGSNEPIAYKDDELYIPLEKIDENVVYQDQAPVYTFKPNRETMHMLIKRAVNVTDVYELFCESVDGFKRMSTIRSGDSLNKDEDLSDY